MKVIRSKSLKQVLQYAKPYQKRFNWVIAWAILLSIFAAARPYLFKQTVDVYLKENDSQGLHFYVIIMAAVLIAGSFSTVLLYLLGKLVRTRHH
jgi:ATP-binding cassette, subfamily B, multidrug efflux pump